MDKNFKNKFIFLLIISSFVITGCTIPGISKPQPKPKPKQDNQGQGQVINSDNTGAAAGTVLEQLKAQNDINKFASLDELSDFLENNTQSSTMGMGYGRGEMVMDFAEGMAMDSTAEMGALTTKSLAVNEAAAPGKGGSDDFSRTNVQVEGVDEADIIKTDGKYIYALVKNDLYIINAFPAEKSEVLTKIAFKSRPQDIYINEDKLVVYGQNSVIYETPYYEKLRRRSPYTFFKVFDITDIKKPKQVLDLDFEGTLANSRMIGDYVYFVTTNHNYYYIDAEPILPRLLEGGKVVDCTANARCVMPEIYYFNIPYSNYNFTVVSAINIKDADKAINQEMYLMSNAQNMYVSQKNLYITYTKYVSEYQLEMEVMKEIVYPRLSAKDQDKIAKIEIVENYILSPDEKQRKISAIIERYVYTLSEEEQENLEDELEAAMKQKYQDISKELEKTVIHKVAINKDKIEYQTNGQVTGHVLNQFSMDEQGDYFRIATTKNRTWTRYMDGEERESYSNLYVLDKDLNQVGAVERLAKGERIYSVRFMQGRAYMVTFKQIDPLFVIDLSDPKNPKVLGELKIPGFSNYLHPYDDKHLIGIGKDTAESEWGGVRIKGIKISLFDVSDVSNPKEVDTYVMGEAGSDSIALHDHKAFLFSKDKNLMAMPVSIRETIDGRSYGKLTFSGAAVFTITENKIELKGKIDHSDGGRPSPRDHWRGYDYYDNSVKRCLYIDDVIYSFSNNYLSMNDLGNDLNEINKLKLEKKKSSDDDDFEIIN
ncbi:beta-propeller domain-containing protein [Candidatus Parcubacteria bacterium]|nr:beta-propeller domain-containing protein [Candidatus Parcubacteria bacterium]